MKKILIVCKGNICRSPLAHGLLDKKIKMHNLPWSVDSAGTGHWHIGKLPDSRSIKVARSNQLDITYQRARQFAMEDFDKSDIIYVMDEQNHSMLMGCARHDGDRSKINMIMNELYPGTDKDVPDPFHNGQEDFENVYAVLDEVTDRMINKAIANRPA